MLLKNIKRYLNRYNYFIIFLFFLFFKLLLLFWSAHPFDFWAFVNTIERGTIYDWNIHDSWNKGNFLLYLFYIMYLTYLFFINLFSLYNYDILLLHFFYKLPFLFFDIIIAFMIYGIINKATSNIYYSKIGFFMWFFNPIVFYVYGIHGHYEILVPFALVLLIYGLINNKLFLLSLGFIIGFSTKYFFIIFYPFLFLYFYRNKKIRTFLMFNIYSFIGIIISFLHFIFFPKYLLQSINSILNLSGASNLNSIIVENKIPALNFFSAFYNLFFEGYITNINDPNLYYIANLGIIIILFFLGTHFLIRFFLIIKKKEEYTINLLTLDITLIISYFVIFLTNFQKHYFIWFIPLLLLLIFFYRNKFLIFLFTSFTIIGFLLQFKGELGFRTFFLDLISRPIISFEISNLIILRDSSMIIFLIFLLIIFLINIFNSNKIKENMKLFDFNLYFISCFILFILISIVFIQVIFFYFSETNHNNKLAYLGNLYHNGIIFSNYDVESQNNNIIKFKNYNYRNSLVLYEIVNLNEFQKNYFKASILIKNYKFINEINNSYFNNCLINSYSNTLDMNSKKSYPSFNINLDCIKSDENIIQLENKSININKNDIQLYIYNIPSDKFINMDKYKYLGLISFIILLILFIYIIVTGRDVLK